MSNVVSDSIRLHPTTTAKPQLWDVIFTTGKQVIGEISAETPTCYSIKQHEKKSYFSPEQVVLMTPVTVK